MAPLANTVNEIKSIGKHLHSFRESFKATCEHLSLPTTIDSIKQFGLQDLRNLAIDLRSALRTFPNVRKLPTANRKKNLLDDISRLDSFIHSDAFEIDQFIPLLQAIWIQDTDEVIWDRIYTLVTETTPPPRPPLALTDQTPYLRTTSSYVDSSDHRINTDAVLKQELGSIYIGVPGFFEAFFGDVPELGQTALTILERCKQMDPPLYDGTAWRDWPRAAQEDEVLECLTTTFDLIQTFALEITSGTTARRTMMAQHSKLFKKSIAKRKLDIALMSCNDTSTDNMKWSDVLIPGKLKSSSNLDTNSNTWRDLGRYVREVFSTQDNRRFVLGFTVCGSVMRLWEFDRLGAIASSPFDMNTDPLQFISVILGFLWADDTQLGFDPTITSVNGVRSIQVDLDRQSKRLILDGLIKPPSGVAGRGTTCWKAHLDDDSKTSIVIKDSWQVPEREEEGNILRQIREKDVVNVARYFYHETVIVNREVDDIRDNVRRGLDVTRATDSRQTGLKVVEDSNPGQNPMSRESCLQGKLSSSHTGVPLPPKNKLFSSQNRVHRRVCVRDYGQPICRATSCAAFLNALYNCIEGYQSSHTKLGILQGDISPGNLMINEDAENCSLPGFLIDFDLAIREHQEPASRARGKTGTRPFMAIGLLLEFDFWNYDDDQKLAYSKKGIVADETDFDTLIKARFTPFYQPLVPCANRLRTVVFPGGSRRRVGDRGLYKQIKAVLRNAIEDPGVEDAH